MIYEVIIPDLGATGSDVILEEWLVEEGLQVKAGQPLFIVITDKATVEVEAFQDGYVRELRAKVGESLPSGSVIALLADSLNEPVEQPEPKLVQKAESGPLIIEPHPMKGALSTEARMPASPLARRIAEEQGIELRTITGSGSQGQILKRDVLAAAGRKAIPSKSTAMGAQQQTLTPMQRSIAEKTLRSKSEAPHFYASITIDMQAALETRRQAVEWADKQGWAKPSITDLCIKAVALSLNEFPMLNASLEGEILTTYSEINIGLVVGLEEGMLVPVVHQADQLNLYTIAATTQRLRKGAKAGQLGARDLSGGTFTISNLGMYGLDSFTAVLNPPQVGILALGAVQERASVLEGALCVRPLMTATLSVDHRVVSGINAARFMASFKEMLEQPARLTLDAPTETSE